ncbi:hypothetical protein [Desulfuromonas sp. AOP6]|uniref:hypothetical protein n=1 Tax=Desulfuromonas sp. AOP6 TaxID=1566351 RepID=UPI00127EB576|nr:hypothetical protein [Desulfuromonas sp. AOP6]BCA79459.1 hypothetical protein AOP6_1246 [Desulfuromonas sp. AOP6]
MTQTDHTAAADHLFTPENFNVNSLQDEIRLNDLIDRLLKLFYLDLIEQQSQSPEEASEKAYAASYFLKDFVIDHCRENIFHLRLNRVRQFAGNWYIVRNLEPNMVELASLLQGIQAFYRYLATAGQISAELAAAIDKDCENLDYYRERIESFWAIEKDGFFSWEAACPLKDNP